MLVPEFSGHFSLLAAVRDAGRTVLAAQSFRAPYHLSKPYRDAETGVLIVQVVNPTAGILSGDRLESDIAVQTGAALLVTTPSASRVFQMRGGEAECRQRFTVANGGWLEVMPEPLVPHRGSRYRQITSVDVEPGGALFFADQLVPGRIAHGEAWEWERLRLELTVRLGGELILRERFDHGGDELHALAELAGSGPAACFANAIFIAPDCAADAPWRAEVEALPADPGRGFPTPPSAPREQAEPPGPADPALRRQLWVGVSALRRGGWSLKFVAPDNLRLREALRAARGILARHFPRLACDPRKL